MPSKNELTITDNSGTITGIDYVSNSVRKPDKVKSSGSPSVSKNGKVFTITFYCDRSGEKGVAGSFNSSSGGPLNRYAAKGGKGGGPDKLNFWFSLKLNVATVRGASQATLNVGQGHSGTDNNWWIGGSIVDSNQPALRIPLGSGQEEVTLPLTGGVSDYTLSAGHFARAYPINYVFVLMLENHSFDNMFAMSGIPGITAATTRDSNSYEGQTYKVNADGVAQMPTDPLHEFQDVVEQLAGEGTIFPQGGPYPAINNSGFAANYATTFKHHPPSPGLIMSCIDTPNLAPVIYSLATNFVLCDHWFSSLPGPTWPNRYFVHGASSNGLETSQTAEEMVEWMAPGGGFEYPHGSFYDALKGLVPYALYADLDNEFSNDPSPPDELGWIPQVTSIKGIPVLSVKNVVDLANDLQGNYKAQYTFIEPNYGDIAFDTYKGGSSQHPMDDLYGGEGLIKCVYEAIRNSPLWNESLLIVTYDEHGGFYDSVAPGSITEPGDGSNSSKLNKFGFQFNQAGVRVPAILVSPWLGKGVIDKTVYDHTTVLATAEKVLNIKPLTDRDKHAKNPLHLLLKSARTDCPTTLPKPVSTVPKSDPKARTAMRERKLNEFLPFHGNLVGQLGLLLKLDIELSDGSKAARAEAVARYRSLRTRRDAQAYAKRILAKYNAVETASGAGSKATTKRRRSAITAARKARRRRAPKRAR
jgi:phospholipase C